MESNSQVSEINWSKSPFETSSWFSITSNRRHLSNILFTFAIPPAIATYATFQRAAKPITRALSLLTSALFISGVILRCLPSSKRCPEWILQQRKDAKDKFDTGNLKFEEMQYPLIFSNEEVKTLLKCDILAKTYDQFITKHGLNVLTFLDQANKDLLKPKYTEWLFTNQDAREIQEIADDIPSKALNVSKDEIADLFLWQNPEFVTQFSLFEKNQEEYATKKVGNEDFDNMDERFLMGYCREQGIGQGKDNLALNSYYAAAKKGHKLALSYIVLMSALSDRIKKFYSDKNLVLTNPQLAIRFTERLAKNGDPISQCRLAMIYEKNLIPESYDNENIEKMDYWYKHSSEQGYLPAIVRSEYKKAKEGDVEAQYRCGRALLQLFRRGFHSSTEEERVCKDLEQEGIAYLENLNNPESNYELGFHYLLLGSICTWSTRYPAEARTKTNAIGDDRKNKIKSHVYLFPDSNSDQAENLKKAFEFLLKAANENHSLAQSTLGFLVKTFPEFCRDRIPAENYETCNAYDPGLACQRFFTIIIHGEYCHIANYYLYSAGEKFDALKKLTSGQECKSCTVTVSHETTTDPKEIVHFKELKNVPKHCLNRKSDQHQNSSFLRYMRRLEYS